MSEVGQEEQAIVNVDGKNYAVSDCTSEVRGILFDLQKAQEGLAMMKSILNCAETGREQLLMKVKKLLPNPLPTVQASAPPPEPSDISDEDVTTDSVEVNTH